ncbi:hypothetical protein GALMADRAFT_231128 [Galerina marginata CBS 339.88]|uniref:Cytochrome P450 n=1 Tax=Galerina marginata (strain CBS 339.88) TaxID=685588 RepID=A0A067SM59_GALM3|nr:hypothetical protein GALMADRAFT_231128 [Galerina marginata CBS 339.88]
MLSNTSILPPSFFFCLVLYYGCLWYISGPRMRARGFRLPPGPPQMFLTGNLHDLSTKARTEPWLTFTAWSRAYGPVVYFRVLNQKTVLLNSGKVALDLLESRSAIYSDRPTFWMGELAGRKWSVFLISSLEPRFRLFRRLLQNGLNPRASKSYRPIQTQEAQILLQGLANSPRNFASHIRRVPQLASRLRGTRPYWIEFLPILRFVPAWFPGAGFKRTTFEIGPKLSQTEDIPPEWAQEQIATGNFIESFTSKHLLGLGDVKILNQSSPDDIKWCAGALYVGGGDTTVSALKSFVLLVALHPDIQKRAQEDIDSITPNRLPTHDDFDSLPFIRAIVKETLRWAPVAPLGIPHRVIRDDIYENYFIPKGSRVIANIWAITHAEELYPNPGAFDPSRYLPGDHKFQPDPFKFVFGFGRRVCPGAHLAEMSLFLNMASILAVFKISKDVDVNGVEIEPEIAWTTGTTRHLKPFRCQIMPRSKEHLSLLG